VTDEPRAQLAALAATACQHARERHGERLAVSAADAAVVDRILDREAGAADVDMLGVCYGAWLGEVGVRDFAAAWTGLSEPAAPRLRLGAVVVSPIDAIARRLRGVADSPSVTAILVRFGAWATAPVGPDHAEILASNRAAWTALASDPRFIGDGLPADDSGLDPWLRAEGVAGKDVLCLAAGGGRHAPLLAAAGARVTVVDWCDAQLAHDRRAAAAGAAISVVTASLDDLSVLPAQAFDVALQPVAACYLRDLTPAHAEVARVLRPGGLFVVQHKQPATLQVTASGTDLPLQLPYVDGLALPAITGVAHREADAAEFLHTLDALLGGLCRAGFVIEDVNEPLLADALAAVGSAGHRAVVLPPYLKIKARRR